MNIVLKALQGQGKTASQMFLMMQMWEKFGYRPEDTVGNVKVNFEGYTYLDNEELRDFVATMVTKRRMKKVILIDEMDRVFPSRLFGKDKQTDAVLNLWQDEKMFNVIIGATHLGTSIDAIIRMATHVTMIPRYNRATDEIRLYTINSLHQETFWGRFRHVSRLWTGRMPVYDRWQPVE